MCLREILGVLKQRRLNFSLHLSSTHLLLSVIILNSDPHRFPPSRSPFDTNPQQRAHGN